MLTETSKGRRRLFKPGDPCHHLRTGKNTPNEKDIPEKYRELIDWYHRDYIGGDDTEELDPILKAYVEDDLSFDEIVALGNDPEVVKKIIDLVDRSEYKRRQAAPGIKITPRNFGRDRRMPIANRWRAY